jgi:hypothetical protein
MRNKPTMKKWQVASNVMNGWPASDREAMMLMKTMSRKCRVLILKNTTPDIKKYHN